MKLDKEAVLQAREAYRVMNEAEFIDRVRNAGRESPADRVQQYRGLVSLCLRLSPAPSIWEHRRNAEAWDAYYAALRRFEERRKAIAEGPGASAS